MTDGATTLVVGSRGPLVLELARGLCEAGSTVELLLSDERKRPSSPGLEELTGEGVRWLSGDPAAIDFGLSGPEYRGLLARTGRVVLAFEPEPHVPSDVERSRSVRAAAELLEFVRSGGGRDGIVYLSSLLVFGGATGRVQESDFRRGQAFANRFEESLAVAERIVRHAEALASVRVLRAAPVVGDASRGELFGDSALAELLGHVRRAPSQSEVQLSELPIYLETSERVASALLCLHAESRPLTAHLVDLPPASARELLEWVGEACDREFREPLAQGRGRARRGPLDELASVERRALAGWPLEFARDNAQALFPDLLDRPLGPVLKRLIDPEGDAPAASSP